MLKTLFFFTGGVVAGAQLGGFVGLRSAQSIVRSEGNVDHINGAIQKTQDDLRRRSLAGNGRSQQQSGRANEAVAQPMDGENTPLAYQWHQEQQTNSFTEYQAPSTEVDLNAPPRSVAELLVASQQPMAQQDLPVYQQMLGMFRIPTMTPV